MGNNTSNNLAIQALTQVTSFGEEDLFNLRNFCIQFLSRGGHDPEMRSILRIDFHTAMKMAGFNEDSSDWELFDCLFTMFDMTGDERINPISLLIGISPLAVKNGDAYSKTLLAFGLFDIKKTGKVKVDDITYILGNINNVASYFGDNVLKNMQVRMIAEDIIKSADETEVENQKNRDRPHGEGRCRSIKYEDHINNAIGHSLVSKFIDGSLDRYRTN